MSIFTSKRERRLWLWTLVVLAAIYSTLGPAGAVVEVLRERKLLRVSMALVLLLAVGGMAWQWVRRRPSFGEIGEVMGVTAVYLLAWIRIPIPEERTHLIEYGLVGLLIYGALRERWRNEGWAQAPAVMAVVMTALLGLLDECIQAILPNRVFDVRDVGFNALAGLMAVGASVALSLARRWRRGSS